MSRSESVRRAADQWAKALTDPSGRNRLLFYKPLRLGTLDLGGADPAALRRLLGAKPGTTVPLSRLIGGGPDEGEGSVPDAVRRARAVSRKATENFEERGVNTLFLAQGMATWEPPAGGSSARPAAPVLMCAVGLHRRGASEADFDLSLDGEWTLNDALLRHLARWFNVTVSGEELLGAKLSDTRLDDDEVAEIFDDLTARARRIPGFGIERRRLVVGNFMYRKLPMVSDIETNLEALAEHDLIAAIAGDGDALEALRGEHTHEVDPALPDATPPADEYLVLDADSSQHRAINAALAGESFVLQGPPGTGKSQTIANLVAAMMARGRSVLFVAEKRAAIEAVTKRLRNVGLDGFVMDLHGGTVKRRELARRLDESLTAISATPPVDDAGLHVRLAGVRAELSGYVEALHRPREPWGLSLFEAQDRLLALRGGPDDPAGGGGEEGEPNRVRTSAGALFPADVLAEIDGESVGEVRRDLTDWADLSEPILAGRSPWAGARITTVGEVRRAQELLGDLAAATRAAWERCVGIPDELGVGDPTSVAAWGNLIDLLGDIERLGAEAAGEIFERDLDRLAGDLAPAAGGLRAAPARLLSGRYRAAVREVAGFSRNVAELRGRQALGLAERARDIVRRWAAFGGEGPPRPPAGLAPAAEAHGALQPPLGELAAMLPEHGLVGMTHTGLAAAVHALAEDRIMLNRLPRLAELEERIAGAGAGVLLEKVRSGDLAPSGLSDEFDRAWLGSIHREVLLSDSLLAAFDGGRQARHVREFREADAAHLDLAPERIRRSVAEHATDVCNAHRDQDALIRREAAKKTRHLPLRGLFEKASDVLTAVRPCWAMSPLDVAQTLPARALFDLVIFDEASQVLPCDAVPALLRAPRAMVAGDSRQLPPTVFFDGADDDESDDGGSLAGFESILDVMDALLSRRPLTWHYRSTDERLIAFSNRNIYRGSLTTFPGAAGGECLRFEPVEHRPGEATDTRSNPDEVRRVVDLMIEHARQRPGESLGVIAMGRYHADRIEEVLRRRLAAESSPELEVFFDEAAPERSFVKNLERVQGDERDAIVLSIGYGKNPAGQVVYRFGPLNQEGGERRLNVAVTRARRRMTVVSSFSHAEMDPNRTSAEGVAQLRGYLKYVETAGADLDGAEEAEPLNSFEIDVMDKLTAAGLSVVPQYGCSGYRIDFAVRHPTDPGRFVLAVEADGATYHSSNTARDRDRLRQEHLERLGWRFCRIWSTDWFNDHARELDRVLEAYRHAVTESDAGGTGAGDQRRAARGGAGGAESGRGRSGDGERGGDGVGEDGAARAAGSGGGGRGAVAVAAAGGDGRAAEASGPTRRGPPPHIPRGVPIAEHSMRTLVRLARWVNSDGLLRTDEQVFDEMFERLGYGRRGSRIRAVLYEAIGSARASTAGDHIDGGEADSGGGRGGTAERRGSERSRAQRGQGATPARAGAALQLPVGVSIGRHKTNRLVELAAWIRSDGRPRSDEEVFDEMCGRLGYTGREPGVRDALYLAIERDAYLTRTYGNL